MIKYNKKRLTGPGWRGALAAAWAIACMLPLPALAQIAQTSAGCSADLAGTHQYAPTSLDQITSIRETFAPAQIRLEKNTPAGTLIYQNSLPTIPWVCASNIATRTPILVAGTQLSIVLDRLRSVGLELTLEINGQTWKPTGSTADDRFVIPGAVYAPASASDPTLIAYGVLSGSLKLTVATPPTKPVRTQIRIYDDLVNMRYGILSGPMLRIGSRNETEILLVPTCIAKVSTPGTVNLGKVYSAGNLPLPAPTRFNLITNFDTNCDGGFTLADLGNMSVPLKIMFQPEGNTLMTSGNRGIVLVNSDGTPNGLALEIRRTPASIPFPFGEFHDADNSLNPATIPQFESYSAALVKTGTPLVPGSFSQQVTVLVTYL